MTHFEVPSINDRIVQAFAVKYKSALEKSLKCQQEGDTDGSIRWNVVALTWVQAQEVVMSIR